jgi:trehalose-6-phosphatase
MTKKKLILFDFDGVVSQYSTNNWKGIDIIEGDVVPGMKELIAELREKYQIYIYSSRCSENKGIKAIEKWLNKKGIAVDGITSKKLPYASILVDDRAINFNGSVDKLRKDIENFQVWTKK